MNHMDKIIAERIKELRNSKNITQEKLAEICGISRSKVSCWENANRDMSITDAINLANYFKISVDSLLNRDVLCKEEYIRISQKFFSRCKCSIEEKIQIIRLIEDGIMKDNISEIYEKYKMLQNETK